MDLISREAAIEFAKEQMEKETGAYSKGRNAALLVMKSALNNPDAIPSVPAVPLDKLCALFEGADIVMQCVLCEKIMPGWCERVNGRPITWHLDKAIQCPSWKEVLTALRKNETEERKDAK